MGHCPSNVRPYHLPYLPPIPRQTSQCRDCSSLVCSYGQNRISYGETKCQTYLGPFRRTHGTTYGRAHQEAFFVRTLRQTFSVTNGRAHRESISCTLHVQANCCSFHSKTYVSTHEFPFWYFTYTCPYQDAHYGQANVATHRTTHGFPYPYGTHT